MSFGGDDGDGNNTDGRGSEQEDPVDSSSAVLSSSADEQSFESDGSEEIESESEDDLADAFVIGKNGELEPEHRLVDAPSPFDVSASRIEQHSEQERQSRQEAERRVARARQRRAAASQRSTRMATSQSIRAQGDRHSLRRQQTNAQSHQPRAPSASSATAAASRTRMVSPRSRQEPEPAQPSAQTSSIYASGTAMGSVCTACSRPIGMSDDRRRPYIALQCGHSYHQRCYELARFDAKGSACPACFSSKRFDNLMTNHSADNIVGAMRALSMDSSIGAVMASAYMNELTAKQIWIGMIENGGVLDVINNPRANLWTECDPNNHAEATRRARLQGNAVTKSREKVQRYLLERVDPLVIMQDGVDVADFVRAGVTVDNFVGVGYNLEDLYNIGFRNWSQLLSIGAHPKHLMMQNGYVPFDVQHLVNYYHHSYADIITFIAMSIGKVAQPTLAMFRRAVRYFCSVGFTSDDLYALGLTDVRMLFSYGGQNPQDPSQCALTADGFVDLCMHMNTDLPRIKDALKVDARLLLELRFTMQHIEELDWQDEEISREFGSDFLDTLHREEKRRSAMRSRRASRRIKDQQSAEQKSKRKDPRAKRAGRRQRPRPPSKPSESGKQRAPPPQRKQSEPPKRRKAVRTSSGGSSSEERRSHSDGLVAPPPSAPKRQSDSEAPLRSTYQPVRAQKKNTRDSVFI